MKKVIKYFAGLLVIFVFVIGLYLYKLHALAVEGNEIFASSMHKGKPSTDSV